jgi:hypothetical protein
MIKRRYVAGKAGIAKKGKGCTEIVKDVRGMWIA